jgi:ketosteroid isomerase-like protein
MVGRLALLDQLNSIAVPLAALPASRSTRNTRDTGRAMSQENLEIVRAAIDALNRGDLEGVLKGADPDFEFDFSRAVGPVQGVFTLGQARGFLEEFFGMWEAVRWEIDELREVGDHVAASFTSYTRGRDGIEITARPSWVWTFRDGSLVRQCFYQEWQEALEAVGLRE